MNESIKSQLFLIAQENIPGLHNRKDLSTQNSDGLDFLDGISVWSLEAALEAAYLLGRNAADCPHGYWFSTEYDYFTCSNCGKDVSSHCDSTSEAQEKLAARDSLYPYCPHCHAVMDLEPKQPKRRPRKSC